MHLIGSVIKRYQNGSDFFDNITPQHGSFILVRHPFSRLVSAYRDKLERTSTQPNYLKDYYYRQYGYEAVLTFRPAAKEKFGEKFFSAANHFGSPMLESQTGLRGNRTKYHPTFWEFVQLLKTHMPNQMDDHWRPVFHHCLLCKVNYSHVFKYENLEEETTMIKKLLNPMRNNPEAKVGNFNPTDKMVNGSWITLQYFQQLSQRDILDLYDIYELDFHLFGYTFKLGNISLPIATQPN